MAIKVERLPGERVIVSTYEGEVTAKVVEANAQTVAPHVMAMIQEDPVKTIYLVMDTRAAAVAFGDILQIARTTNPNQPPPEIMPVEQVKLIFVGTAAMVKLYVDMIAQKQFGGNQVPLFQTLEDALNYVRTESNSS